MLTLKKAEHIYTLHKVKTQVSDIARMQRSLNQEIKPFTVLINSIRSKASIASGLRSFFQLVEIAIV